MSDKLVKDLPLTDAEAESRGLGQEWEQAILLPKLWGQVDVANFLGVAPPNVYKIPTLPKAIVELRRGRLWRADDIRAFVHEWRK